MAGENGAGGDMSPVETKIISQIEYYFGDMNLPRDRFLQDQMTQDDGWVTLETMLKFNRLKQISDDQDVIAAALAKSTSGLMEVSEDKKKIRRSPDKPIPDNTKERREEIASRSVYAKGFPIEYTLDEVQEFFSKHGKIENVQMRRMLDTKEFKGSVFAVFAAKEDAAKFVKEETIKCGEAELVRLFKDEYFKKKTEDKNRVKKQKSEESKAKEQEDDEKLKERYKKATILKLEGLPGDISLEDVKNFFSDFGSVAWVDHDKGDTKGYVRFREENEATTALAKAKEDGEGKIEINNNEVEAKVLDGEEELNHWKMIFKNRTQNRKPFNRRHQSNRGSFKGRKRSFRGGKGGGEPRAKSAKASND